MTITSTNVLALPLAQVTITTGNNEDWIDAFEYVTGDATPLPLDIRGINFQLMVRRFADDPEVIVWASTEDNTIQVGTTPNHNFLIINVPYSTMKTRTPGTYVADMLASDGVWQRRVMNIDLQIIDGVTK